MFLFIHFLSDTPRQRGWRGFVLIAICVAASGCDPEPRSAGNDNRSTNPSIEGAGTVGENALQPTLACRDPANDGWDTEVLNDRIGAQLQKFGALLSHPHELNSAALSELVTATVRHGRLRPTDRTPLYESSSVNVFRGDSELGNVRDGTPASLAEELRHLADFFSGQEHVHTKFKIVRVDSDGDRVETDAYFQADSAIDDGVAQVNATWHCVWVNKTEGKDTGQIRLQEVTVSGYREVVGHGEDQLALFADCTASVLGSNDCYSDQVLKSTNYWRGNLQASLGVDLLGHQGLAIGDVDSDGLDDVYLCQPGGVTNRLFRHLPDGTALDISAASGVDLLDRSRSALFVDFDNDGDQDLVVMVDARVVFFANQWQAGNKDVIFKIVADHDVGVSVTLTAADYDLDGDVDLYVCGYSAPRGGEGAPIPYHDANNGFRNHLLRNDGDFQFVDVTDEVGLNQNNRRFTLSAAWDDFDNDGDPDLYVANDFGRNNLYRNDRGTFVDIAADAGVEDISAGMGIAWGDYDRDGWVDIHVSNMFSSAGNRVAYQRKFRTGDSDKAEFQRHARGNSLFRNLGDGTFEDVSEQANVTMGRWAWASLFSDINNDSHPDILVTNGLATNEDTKDL